MFIDVSGTTQYYMALTLTLTLVHHVQLLVQHFAHGSDVEPDGSDERRAAARQARANIG